MKSQSNSLGISSTNARALSTRISNIMTEIRPSISVRSTKADPPACISAKVAWIDRKVRVAVNLSGNSYMLTMADLSSALGASSGLLKILGFKAWSIPTNGSSELVVQTQTAITTTGVYTKATDYGSGSRMAGVAVNIPDPLSETLGLSVSTTQLLSVSSSISSNGKIIVDFHVRYSLNQP